MDWGTFIDSLTKILGGLVVLVVGAFASYVALRVKKVLEQREQALIKRQTVEDCVKAVEQVYADLDGPAKKAKAEQGIRELLAAKGIEITDFELDILIEACVKELNCGLFSGGKKLGDTAAKKK